MRRIILLAFLAFIVGCSSTPEDPAATPAAQLDRLPPATTAEARQALSQLPSEQRIDPSLHWAEHYLDNQRPDASEDLLLPLDSGAMTQQQFNKWLQLRFQALSSQRQYQSITSLYRQHMRNIEMLPAKQQARLELMVADALASDGQDYASIELRVAAIGLLPQRQQRALNDQLWQQLQQLSLAEITSGRQRSRGEVLGWFELAELFRDSGRDLDRQVDVLQQWQNQWRQHPGLDQLDELLGALQTATRLRPERIAVMVPETGPLAEAGQAIRDGMLTAFYARQSQGLHTPSIRFYNSNTRDIIGLYEDVIADGADLVIGPLDRDQVSSIAAAGDLPVPTLALNYIDISRPRTNFYQYGLAPEDESIQIARDNLLAGAHRAAVLYPPGDWGSRVSESFEQAWQDGGGKIAVSHVYGQGAAIGDAVKAVLQVDQSEQRANQIRRFTNLTVDSIPVPRQDIDMVFLVANPTQGRQIKPAFNFNYAAAVPVHATALIFSGTPDPQQDHDLNGVRFVDMPWLVSDTPSEVKQLAMEQWPAGYGRFERLFAMGADALLLQSRLGVLDALPGALLNGETGSLTLQDGRIVRHLQWAEFQRGVPQPIPRPTFGTATPLTREP